MFTFHGIPLLILVRARCWLAVNFYSVSIFALQEYVAVSIAVTEYGAKTTYGRKTVFWLMGTVHHGRESVLTRVAHGGGSETM